MLDQELKPDQDPDREHDREQKVALFHRRVGAASRLDRDRVVAAAAPGMAAQQAPSGQQRAAPRSVHADRFGRIVRAARVIAARRREEPARSAAGRRGSLPAASDPATGPAPPLRINSILLDALRSRSAAQLAAGRQARCRPGWLLRPACRSTCRSADAEIAEQVRIAPLSGAGSGDQDIIGPGPPVARQNLGRGRAQPPLRPVANDRVADLAARRKADPHSAPHRPRTGTSPLATSRPGRTARRPAPRHGENRRGSLVLQGRSASLHHQPRPSCAGAASRTARMQ